MVFDENVYPSRLQTGDQVCQACRAARNISGRTAGDINPVAISVIPDIGVDQVAITVSVDDTEHAPPQVGLGDDDLRCGAHAPFDGATRAAMRNRGETPCQVHNNCSGKHAFMLAFATNFFAAMTPQASSANVLFAGSGYLTQQEMYRNGAIITIANFVIYMVCTPWVLWMGG